jgi:hypothetical protein
MSTTNNITNSSAMSDDFVHITEADFARLELTQQVVVVPHHEEPGTRTSREDEQQEEEQVGGSKEEEEEEEEERHDQQSSSPHTTSFIRSTSIACYTSCQDHSSS